jgi:hypothetical protein
MGKFRAWLMIVGLSIKWIFRVTLGDEVVYQGKKYRVANGNVCDCWRLADLNPDYYKCYVKQKDCKKIWSIKGMIRSFQSGYWFYMTTWYSIWAREGIKSWMKSCNIW